MTDKEKLEKIYEFVKHEEDRFYKPIEDGKYEAGSLGSLQCILQASSFQRVRYLIENLMEVQDE